MPLSKRVLTKIEADGVVIPYKAQKFPQNISRSAHEFIRHNYDRGETNFEIDQNVAQQTGIEKLRKHALEKQFEEETLANLKEIQEGAYREAYALGLDEGRKSAFEEKSNELEEGLRNLHSVLASLERLKTDLVQHNEAHLIRMITHISSKLVGREIETDPSVIVNILNESAQATQEDERLKIYLSPRDAEFVQGLSKDRGSSLELLKRSEILASDQIHDGGCVIETNYGRVDATIEARVEKLWETLSGQLVKIKDQVGGENES